MSKYMYSLLLFMCSGYWQSCFNAQSVAINSSGNTPHASAILDVTSTTQGILFPKMTQIQRLDIDSPPEGLMVYQTDGNEGVYAVVDGGWKALTKSNYDNIPIGGIVDWLPQGQSLPAGFAICDGTMITDPESPYVNSTLPDLDEQFIKAVHPNNIGATGGSTQHNHAFNLGNVETSITNNPHRHYISPHTILSDTRSHGHSLYVNSTITIDHAYHNHEWGNLNSSENWHAGNGQLIMNWSNGAGPEGSGYYPIAKKSVGGVSSTLKYYTDNDGHTHNNGSMTYTKEYGNAAHSHKIDLPGLYTTEDDHTHSISLGARNTSYSSNLPPYITLVKIMRIK